MRAPSVCILMLCDSDVISVIFGSYLGSDVVRGRLENGADGSSSLRCSRFWSECERELAFVPKSCTSGMAGSTPLFKRPLTTSDPGRDQQGLGNLEPTC